MALAEILRKEQAHLGEQRHENVEAEEEEEVDPVVVVVAAAVVVAGHRTAGEEELLVVEEEEGQLVAEADNATLDGQQEEVVVVEQVLPTGEAPCKEVVFIGIRHSRAGQQIVERVVLQPSSTSSLLLLIVHLVYQHQVLAPSYVSRIRKSPNSKKLERDS